jgi:death-on-curing protein
MTEPPIWLREDVILAIHKRQIAQHGGGVGIRDMGLLDSALHRPKNLYYYSDPKPNIAAMSASYAYGITLNHPFVDGNKRTGFVVCRLFLKLNGAELVASQQEKYTTFIKLAAGEMTEQALTNWLTKHLV